MAVLPFGRSGVISASMLGPRPGARRDGRCRLVLVGTTRPRSASCQPGDTPSRPTSPCSSGRRDDRSRRAHRLRPRAVPHHPRRQHGGALHHLATSRVLGSELMADRHSLDRRPATPGSGLGLRRGEKLPRWASLGHPRRLRAVVTLVLLRGHGVCRGAAIWLVLRARLPGRPDRRELPGGGAPPAPSTGSRTTAVLHGLRRWRMIPLVSVLVTVLGQRARPVSTSEFLTHSHARGRRRGRRRLPRHHRHPRDHRAGHQLISIPIACSSRSTWSSTAAGRWPGWSRSSSTS